MNLLSLLCLPRLSLQRLLKGAGFRLHVLTVRYMALQGRPGLLQFKLQLFPLFLVLRQAGLQWLLLGCATLGGPVKLLLLVMQPAAAKQAQPVASAICHESWTGYVWKLLLEHTARV
jgi:hypothetical protein